VKFVKYLLLLGLPLTIGCISAPIYNTVNTPRGLSIGAGIAYQTGERSGEWVNAWKAQGSFNGFRPEFIISNGVSETFSFEGRFGGIVSPTISWQETDDNDNDSARINFPIPMVGIGFKFATLEKRTVNSAIRIDLDFPNIASVTPMIGICTKTGYEVVTFGIQTTYLVIPRTLFVNLHPFAGAHIYAGVDFLPMEFEAGDLRFNGSPAFKGFCFGIAYAYNSGTKEERY